MKVIFLDIDGVLKQEDYDAEFQDACFARLKRIVDATGAIIILSSSWRISYWDFVEKGYQTDSQSILDLYNHFEKYGLKVSGRPDPARHLCPPPGYGLFLMLYLEYPICPDAGA